MPSPLRKRPAPNGIPNTRLRLGAPKSQLALKFHSSAVPNPGAIWRDLMRGKSGWVSQNEETFGHSEYAGRFENAQVKTKVKLMKIVVIGGSGLIGSKLVPKLRQQGHEAVPASPNTGVNTLTGEGLADVLKGASVVVDVSNSPSWEDSAVLKFFETSTLNLLNYEAAAGVKHHVALSVVGSERMLESGYFRAKIAQEKLIKESSNSYSIVRATQFFEFVKGIADFSTEGNIVRMPHVLIQPMAADDVASGVGKVAVGAPVNGTVEIGGPEQFRLDELVRRGLAAMKDPRQVVMDPHSTYYGIQVQERTLVPEKDAKLGTIRFEEWLTQSTVKTAGVSH